MDIDLLSTVGTDDFNARNFSESLLVSERILEIDSSNENAIHFKGKNFEALGQTKDAINCFEQLNQRYSNNPHYLGDHLGILYFKAGRVQNGVGTIEKAIEIRKKRLIRELM